MKHTEDDEVPEERYDLNEGDEEDCGYSQPALWSVTRTLMDKFQKPDSADTCKSYTSEIENLNGAPGNHALQSPSCEEINEEESTPPFIERSEFLVSGARKDTSMPTDCYDFLGLAAVEKKYVDLSTTETKGGQFFGLADKVSMPIPSSKLQVLSDIVTLVFTCMGYKLQVEPKNW